jgi:hypothetical protein
MCSPLKHALVDHPEPAWKVAQKMEINDVRLSKITRGLTEPREHEKNQLAKILGRRVGDLFPAYLGVAK